MPEHPADATIERAARAARNANHTTVGVSGEDSDWDLGPGFEPTRERYRRIARAVLDAAAVEPAPGARPVTFAELHGEIARRDERIDELFDALTAVVAWWDAGDEPGAVRIAPRAMWDNARTALGWPQPDPALDPADLRITFYDPPDANGFDAAGRGVSILHVPSGWGTSCHSERSQLQNKAQALRALRARVAVWRNTE